MSIAFGIIYAAVISAVCFIGMLKTGEIFFVKSRFFCAENCCVLCCVFCCAFFRSGKLSDKLITKASCSDRFYVYYFQRKKS